MRPTIALSALAAFLALAGVAAGGGWATVGFAPLPDGTPAGAAWTPEITVLQHGRTPLGGLRPQVTIEDVGTGDTHTFAATETSETGVYESDVVFPNAGRWKVAIDSGFGGSESRVTYGPVPIGAVPGASGGERDLVPLPVAAALVVLGLLTVAGAAFGLRRSRILRPASR